jgi:hemoglobin-like flavoprotein
VQLKHLHYFLSAGLTALSISTGTTFPAIAEHWRTVLTHFIDEIALGAGCSDAPAMESAASVSLNPEQHLRSSPKPASSAGASTAPAEGGDEKGRVYSDEECVELTRKSWAKIGEANKRRDIVDTFFQILFTQHPTVKRNLFKDLDVAVLAPLLEQQLDAAIAAPTSPELPSITDIAKTHGVGRAVETRHYHYFLSAMLAAVSLVVGRSEFPEVAEPWRRILTFVLRAMMAGAPPVDKAAAGEDPTTPRPSYAALI